MSKRPLTIEDVIRPPERRFWLDDDMFTLDTEGMYVPRFSVLEASKFFFGENSDWLRWRMRALPASSVKCASCRGIGYWKTASGEKKTCKTCNGEKRITQPSRRPHGWFILDGKPLEFKRLKPSRSQAGDPDAVTARYYTLPDIERMAHALHQEDPDGFPLSRVAATVLTARLSAHLWGIETDLPVTGLAAPKEEPVG